MTQATIEQLEAEVQAAQSRLAEAREAARQARHNERVTALADEDRELLDMDDDEFVTTDARDDTGFVRGTRAVLPFGREYAKWNPRDVENMAFGKSWLAGMSALICRRKDQNRTRPTRLVFSSGRPAELVGTTFEARHDQTGARLGDYQVVGIVMYDAEGDVLRMVGDVPDVKFSQSTYK